MKNYAKIYHYIVTAKDYEEYKNRVKAKKERAYLRNVSKLERLEKKGGITLNSYGDTITDELVSALLCAFCAQRTKQPDKANFWNFKMYELISNNAKGELNNEFIGRACIKLYDFDEKERNENLSLYARKSANHAVYSYKYVEDGKSLAGKNDDYAKTAVSDNNTIISLAYPHYMENLKKAVVYHLVERLTEKQAYSITFWLNNALLFDTLEDIFDFGLDENNKPIKFFKNFQAFKKTFYNARKALKEIANAENSAYMPNFNTLINALYENKTYNAVILANKYEKATAESVARLKAEKASGIVMTYKK